MNSDSSPSSRASSPDMDAMFLREHLPGHHFHHLHPHLSHLQQQHQHPVSSSTQAGKMAESKSASSSSSSVESSSGGGGGGGGGGGNNKFKLKKQVTEEEMYQLRLKINGRERKRMHDLNLAMDGLREVMPYAHGPSVRKLSKIATLLLARNYILMLNSSLDEMKRLVGEIYGGQHSAFHCGGPAAAAAAAAAASAAAASAAAQQAQQAHPLLGGGGLSSSAAAAAASMRAPHAMLKGSPPAPALQLASGFQHWAGLPCPCAICQVPPPPGPVAAPAAPAAAAAAAAAAPPPPHIPITSSGLTRLTAEAKDAMK